MVQANDVLRDLRIITAFISGTPTSLIH